MSVFPLIFTGMHRILASLGWTHGTAGLPLRRVLLHPTSIAAWVGMYATALNLLPAGQLDGGHIVYALAPRVHKVISWVTVLALIYLGWSNYRMVGVGGDRDCDEPLHPQARTGSRVPGAAHKPLGTGAIRGGHAGADGYDFAFPGEGVFAVRW